MGGWNHLSVQAESDPAARTALDSMVTAIREIDRTFSVFDPLSALSQMNTTGALSIPVDSPLLLDAIDASLEHARAFAGVFDPTVEPLMRRWGFRDDPRVAYVPPRHPSIRDWDYRMIVCDRANARIVREAATITLDPGGWAKGLAAERATLAAVRTGAVSAQANCGGDIYWTDNGPGVKRECAIRDPLRGRTDCAVRVRHQFRTVATSANVETFRLTPSGEQIGHLMDPRTGEPAHTGLLSISVFGDDGLAVDAASSALFVMGKCEASRWLSANPQYAAVMIDNRWPKPEGLTVAGALEIQRL